MFESLKEELFALACKQTSYLDGLKKKSIFGIHRELVGETSGRRRHLNVKVARIGHFGKLGESLKSHYGILKRNNSH